ncbi:MAG: hypothetical protein KDB32_08025, partial [Planctomycetes bacterium]|nr:hypothetical protein [Planctomycetota bacterium]
KWVSLMLWAGADPWALGPDDAPDYDFRAYDDEHGPLLYAAVELAVTYDRLEVLKLKNFLKPANREPPNAARIFEHAWKLRDPGVVRLLLERGYGPAQREDRCSELLTGLLCILSSSWTSSRWLAASRRPTHDIDTYQSEQVLEIIGLLLAHGALWAPRDQEEIKRVRGSLLKMAPKYTFEFIELLHKHRAGRRGDVEELIRTPKMTKLMQKRCRKIPALVADLPEELAYPVTAD